MLENLQQVLGLKVKFLGNVPDPNDINYHALVEFFNRGEEGNILAFSPIDPNDNTGEHTTQVSNGVTLIFKDIENSFSKEIIKVILNNAFVIDSKGHVDPVFKD